MRLHQLLAAFPFEDIFAELAIMYPEARKDKARIRETYEQLLATRPVEGKKKIRYQLMMDPDTEEEFFGADDRCFNTSWASCLGKEIVKDPNVQLTEAEMAANCLLNILFIAHKN